MDKLPQHEEIENAFKPAAEILDRLPKTTESDRARFHVGEGYRYAKEARERAKADRTEDVPAVDASIAMRGPVTTGWGWPRAIQITDCVISREASCTD